MLSGVGLRGSVAGCSPESCALSVRIGESASASDGRGSSPSFSGAACGSRSQPVDGAVTFVDVGEPPVDLDADEVLLPRGAEAGDPGERVAGVGPVVDGIFALGSFGGRAAIDYCEITVWEPVPCGVRQSCQFPWLALHPLAVGLAGLIRVS